MTGQREDQEYYVSKNRLETLVDGIFAFAMTLLVLGINPPRPEETLATTVLPDMIASLVPQVFLFIVSFLVLALFWLDHHRQFHFVHRVDTALLWINMLLLISIVFVPFSTDLAGDYPVITDAVLLFHANMFIVGLLFAVQWCHICRHDHLCEPALDEAIKHHGFRRSLIVPAIAVIGGTLSFINPPLSLMMYLVLPFSTGLLHRLPLP